MHVQLWLMNSNFLLKYKYNKDIVRCTTSLGAGVQGMLSSRGYIERSEGFGIDTAFMILIDSQSLSESI